MSIIDDQEIDNACPAYFSKLLGIRNTRALLDQHVGLT